jgi:hypothetical protein
MGLKLEGCLSYTMNALYPGNVPQSVRNDTS